MIEQTGPELPITEDPYEVTEYDLQSRYVASSLADIARILSEISEFSERQRERFAPTIIDVSPDNGQPIASSYQTTQRLRTYQLFFSGGTAASRFRLAFGFRRFTVFASGATFAIPFSYTIDRGIDVSMSDITTPGSVNWSCYLICYPE